MTTDTRYSLQDPDELTLGNALTVLPIMKGAQVTMAQDFGKLAFPGGPVAIPKPTRAALLLSAKQWATAGRERAQEESATPNWETTPEALWFVINCFDRVMKAIAEAEACEK